MAILTWIDIKRAAKLSYGDGRAPNLKDLADFINRRIPELRAVVSEHSETPYIKYKGIRIRYDFKRRYGHRLEVWAKITAFPAGIVRPLLQHDTTDPYRRNWEVARWIVEYKYVSDQVKKGLGIAK